MADQLSANPFFWWNQPVAKAADQQWGGLTYSSGKAQGPGELEQLAQQDWQRLIDANRVNQTNAFGGNTSWTQGPDGKWTQQQSFGKGPMGQAVTGLQNQLFGLGTPMDWSQFGPVGTGDQARQQAIDAAYGQATSRLDPQWDKREDRMRTQLMNQGLDAGSEAYKSSMFDLGQQRNDAYSSAMNNAIGQGTAAGDAAFRNNLLSHNQQVTDALRQRGQPIEELGQFQQFLGQPNYFNLGGPNMMGARMAQNQAGGDFWQGLGNLGLGALKLFL